MDEAAEEVLCIWIRSLDEIDRHPGKFTSLSWFRDQHLPKQGWNLSEDQTQEIIGKATADGILITREVPNPKTPDHPVTSIELNREHPFVRRVLKQTDVASRFQPVSLPGLPLSDTVREDRR